jgi:glycosyltransferase involved in cell wall biosynthesis
MRILFVAFPNSIHSTRWINQVADLGWELHLVPSVLYPLNPHLHSNVKYHGIPQTSVAEARRLAMKILTRWPRHPGSRQARKFFERIVQGSTSAQGLERIIKRVKPDIVHSLEMQQAGYQTLAAKDRMGSNFPTWIMSSWGSDIYLYHRIAAHKERVKRVLANCDYYIADCQRDVYLAQQLGLKGRILPVFSAAGGFDIERLQQFRQPGPPSQRKVILLKGYQHWVGRSLAGLRAIELCADVIRERGYSVLIYLASQDVPLAAELVAQSTGIPIEIVPDVDYIEALKRFGRARIHIGLSVSDGAAQSIFEAMALGVLPIQSCTACVDEWIEDGKSGLIVPPEDPQIIAAALRRAMIDDDFVDQAAKINEQIIRQRLSYTDVKVQVIDMYKSVFAASRH